VARGAEIARGWHGRPVGGIGRSTPGCATVAHIHTWVGVHVLLNRQARRTDVRSRVDLAVRAEAADRGTRGGCGGRGEAVAVAEKSALVVRFGF
jgi:hypothetical protein